MMKHIFTILLLMNVSFSFGQGPAPNKKNADSLTNEKFSVLELTNAGATILKSRAKVTLTKPAVAPEIKVASETKTRHVGEIACDEILFERLRELRKKLADERDVPAYIIFSDVALRQMARNYPETESDFTRISGVGEKKLREFGKVFLNEVAMYLATNPRQICIF